MEKGYRYYGVDLTMAETPLEAGHDRLVAWDKGDFVGRAALVRHRESGPSPLRLRTIVLGDEGAAEADDGWLPIYGGEAVLVEGQVVGRLRSVAFGYTMRRMVGYAYLTRGTPEGSEVVVEVLGREVRASVAADALVDPGGERMRA
jgi:4-methylaminobutanoate oxidase (formaldehyde-forming)